MSGSIFHVDLRRLILWVCLFFVCLAVGNSLHAAYRVQYGLLLQQSLDANRAYAEKLAHVADSFLQTSAQALEAAALDIAESQLDPAAARRELEQLASITNTFNATFAVDASGVVLAARSDRAFPVDTLLQAPQPRRLPAGDETPAVSSAFRDPHGRWQAIISRPILSSDGTQAGFVGGTVQLQSGSALQNALEKLHYQEGSFFYIVDETGTVVYHPDHSLIGSSFKDTPPVPALMRGEAGTDRSSDAATPDHLVSYEPIPFAQWGVVAQRPTEIALSNLGTLFLRTLYYSLPLFIASLLAIWWLAHLIARPLRELAEVAARLDDRASFSRIRSIKSWYVEAALIRTALMQSFSAVGSKLRKLHREGSTDALTGVVNRRGLDTAIERLADEAQALAFVMIDVDHFKAVNDSHGHAVGDEVLKRITTVIMAQSRAQDVVGRMGGEEFLILLPDTAPDAARQFAERVRSAIAQTRFEEAGQVTVSLGVACYPEHAGNAHDALALADAALYAAKAAGRDRVQVA